MRIQTTSVKKSARGLESCASRMGGRTSFRLITQSGRIHPVSGAILQNKPAVAIAAIDIAAVIDFEVNQRMAKRRRAITGSATDRAGAIAADAAGFDDERFGRCGCHEACKYCARARFSIAIARYS